MKNSRIFGLLSSILIMSAASCGGSKSTSGDNSESETFGSGASNADIVAQSVIDSASEQGVELDEECIRIAVNEIPEPDLQIMVDNLVALGSGDADVDTIGISDEGLNGLNAIFDCVTSG